MDIDLVSIKSISAFLGVAYPMRNSELDRPPENWMTGNDSFDSFLKFFSILSIAYAVFIFISDFR